MEPRSVFWRTQWALPGAPGWTLSGYSRAMFRTGFHVGGLNVLLDGGPQRHAPVAAAFITHTHGDHIASLPFTLLRAPGQGGARRGLHACRQALPCDPRRAGPAPESGARAWRARARARARARRGLHACRQALPCDPRA